MYEKVVAKFAFNPTMVRLLLIQNSELFCEPHAFNPTMVRLLRS